MTSIQHIIILVPVYNEEHGIIRMIERLDKVITQSTEKINVLFIDDGSKDNTLSYWRKILKGRKIIPPFFYQEILAMHLH